MTTPEGFRTIFGYGFAPDVLADAWSELEPGAGRGPDCPFTLELVELALGLLDTEEAHRLKAHVADCERCRGRLAAQQRAAADAAKLVRESPATAVMSSVVAEGFRRRRPVPVPRPRLWRGQVADAPTAVAVDDGLEVIDRLATLAPLGAAAGAPQLNVFLRFQRPRHVAESTGPATEPWRLTVRLPVGREESGPGNPRPELENLAGCQLRVLVLSSGGVPEPVEPFLDWDLAGEQLISSRLERVSLQDPRQVERLELVVMPRRSGDLRAD